MIWQRLASFILKNRKSLLIFMLLATIVMAYFASKVTLSYDFARAIPTDNPKYQEYQQFKKIFGEDGNVLMIGTEDKQFFEKEHFNRYVELLQRIKKVPCVKEVLCIPGAILLQKDSVFQKLYPQKIFAHHYDSQSSLDSASKKFHQLQFYKGRLYNPNSHAYLMAVTINKDSLNSPARVAIVTGIISETEKYTKVSRQEVHLSGLPLIRTMVAERIQKEMKLFLLISLILSVLMMLFFFRSIANTLLSIGVVLISVIWTCAIIYLCGYKITLLTALLPSLVVVIGIPNCIYFINKYHTSYIQTQTADSQQRKELALIEMVSKMGVVTLFCNITAAIGFAVFALTHSVILQEFGIVAGISILMIFFISFITLTTVLSLLPPPSQLSLKYLSNKWVNIFLEKIQCWVFERKKVILSVTTIIVIFSVIGIFKLQSVSHIVDDLPKKDKIYTDLQFFEKNFKGIMPLEILIDSKKRRGLRGIKPFYKMDSLASFIATQPYTNTPICISEGLKFATQAFNDNDSSSYRMPSEFESVFLNDYLNQKKDSTQNSQFVKLMSSFIDTSKRFARVSVNMADVGTKHLPVILQQIKEKANLYFDTSYQVTLTGTSITFLEGNQFIINGLSESILWAFFFIALCMLYLFRSIRMLLNTLIVNLIPLVVTAGVMGWAGVPIKPSTVLVFSVALGIAIDITIRFLVNYRQILPACDHDISLTVQKSISQTGLSIIYTSLVLMIGFIIFCASSFGGTFALGWLTSLTLFLATLCNLLVLPVILNLNNNFLK